MIRQLEDRISKAEKASAELNEAFERQTRTLVEKSLALDEATEEAKKWENEYQMSQQSYSVPIVSVLFHLSS